MGDPVRVAILGNSFASRVQLPALRWAGGNEVIGLAGHDLEKAERVAREAGIPLATGDYRELLDLAPDLVLVSTPVHLHHEMTLAALAAGAAVLCEKPFALDEREAESMTAAAKGKAAWLDHQLRWNPNLLVFRRIVRDGLVGEPWRLRFDMLLPTTRFRTRPWSWWFEASKGGGVLGAIGSHMLDLLRWLFGEIASVRGDLQTLIAERPDAAGSSRPVTADEHAHLGLQFESGLVGELTTSIATPSDHAFDLQVVGSKGTLRLRDGEHLFAAASGEPLERVTVDPGLPPAEAFGMDDGGIFARALPLYLRDVIEALREGRTEVREAATFEDGLAIQRVLDAARASSAGDGGWRDCQ